MKNTLIIIYIMATSLTAVAQSQPVQHWEGGVFVGPTVSLGRSPKHISGLALDSRPAIGYSAGAELRYNISTVPMDIGLHASFDKIAHDEHWASGITYWHKNYTNNWTIAALADWNFNRGGKVSPFAGVGAGVSIHSQGGYTGTSAVFMPRAGIELFNSLRVAVQANLSKKEYNNMMLSLGWAFGGQPLSKIQADRAKELRQPIDDQVISRLYRQANTCKWIGVGALGLGIPTVVLGTIITATLDAEGGENAIGPAIIATGGVVALSSIPLFVISHNKRAKANRLSVGLAALDTAPNGRHGLTAGIGMSLNF